MDDGSHVLLDGLVIVSVFAWELCEVWYSISNNIYVLTTNNFDSAVRFVGPMFAQHSAHIHTLYSIIAWNDKIEMNGTQQRVLPNRARACTHIHTFCAETFPIKFIPLSMMHTHAGQTPVQLPSVPGTAAIDGALAFHSSDGMQPFDCIIHTPSVPPTPTSPTHVAHNVAPFATPECNII